jgi:site-specific DNA-methyltransferase (adenine-specific)
MERPDKILLKRIHYPGRIRGSGCYDTQERAAQVTTVTYNSSKTMELEDYEYFKTDNGTLYQGDCLEILPLLEDESVDLVLTDPPYGTTQCNWDSVIPLEPMWKQLKQVIKPNGAIVMTASQPFTTTMIASNMKMFKYCWVWDKKKPSTGLHAKIMPLRKTEDVIVFGKSKVNYYPQMVESKIRTDKPRVANNGEVFGGKEVLRQHSNNGMMYPKNIIEITNANQNGRVHPTQKPVALMNYLIRTYTEKGNLVLDFTIGSGTTAVACEELGRKWIGIELSKDYCEIAKKRLEAWKGQTRFF